MLYSYPIHELIENRREELGIRRGELALRCGYKNISRAAADLIESWGIPKSACISFKLLAGMGGWQAW